MVQRQSTAVDFGNIQSPQIAGAQVGTARVDVARFYDPTGSAQTPVPSFMDGLLKIIAPAAGQLGKAAMTVGQDEAYLRGSAAAGTGRAEADIESNFMTKDWATAGYRDTTTRLKAADAEAQTAVDMAKLREQSPAKFGEYLAARREDLYSNVQGMSLPARKSMLAQQLVSERAAISKHSMEHKAFMIDQDIKASAADANVKFDSMDRAKGDLETYNLATGNAFTSIYGNIWQNTRLPEDARNKATVQAMQGALSRNHQQLYQMLKTQPVTMLDGTTATMFSRLPFDDQVKLSKAYDSSMSATAAERNAEKNVQIGLMLGSFKDPTQPATSWADFNAVLASSIKDGTMSEADVRSYTKQWQESQAKRGGQAAGAAAFATGNAQLGSDLGESAEVQGQHWQAAQQQAGTPIDVIMTRALDIGDRTGSPVAYKIAGTYLSNAMAAIKPDSPGNPANAALLQTALKRMWGSTAEPGMPVDRGAQGSGRSGDMVAMLSGMSEPERARFMIYGAALAETGDPNSAAATVIELDVKNATISQDMRKAMRGTANADNAKAIADLAPTQLWGAVSKRALNFLGMAPGDQAKLTKQTFWFQDPEKAERAMAEGRSAFAQSISRLSELNPYHSSPSLANLALADVASRTLDLDSGLLTIPYLGKGVPMQSYFGVGIGVTPSTISKAISGSFQPLQPGNTMTFHTGSGVIRYQEFSERGEAVRSGTFDPKSMAKVIGEEDAKAGVRFDTLSGAGVTRTGSTGAKVTYNGESTISGRSNESMLKIRDIIVKYEGVRDTEYEDTAGNKTIGVGILQSKKSTGQPGTWAVPVDANGKASQAAINKSFMVATNAAATAGDSIAKAYRLSNNGFELMTELAYHSGLGFLQLRGYQPFLAAMRSRDKAAAATAFQKSPAWAASGPERKAHYLDQINKSME